ncbi:uncharacterized protein LOC143443107 [Arvicanthis niloticus]|uniref:uncharacterized protein LOC143313327 n=1 Tax=Arvicanthis niloticus TaxID=61156 RepID=UPI00402BF002
MKRKRGSCCFHLWTWEQRWRENHSILLVQEIKFDYREKLCRACQIARATQEQTSSLICRICSSILLRTNPPSALFATNGQETTGKPAPHTALTEKEQQQESYVSNIFHQSQSD